MGGSGGASRCQVRVKRRADGREARAGAAGGYERERDCVGNHSPWDVSARPTFALTREI